MPLVDDAEVTLDRIDTDREFVWQIVEQRGLPANDCVNAAGACDVDLKNRVIARSRSTLG
jgi:hypothetical protein